MTHFYQNTALCITYVAKRDFCVANM